jgi:hypothetical protein
MMNSPAGQAYARVPIYFEENQGQVDSQVKFLTRTGGSTIFLTASEAVFALPHSNCGLPDIDALRDGAIENTARSNCEPQMSVLRMQLSGANPSPNVVGLDRLEGIVNYFIGTDPAQWHANIPTFGRVQYNEVYPGVNLIYYGDGRQLEYDFQVQPGADPGRVSLNFVGADDLHLDANGDLVIMTAAGEVRQQKPLVYQDTDEGRQQIQGNYLLKGNSEVGFSLGAYNLSRPLIIDPVLAYSTLVGGSGSDSGISIAVDAFGNAYVTGETGSTNFPIANAFQPNPGGGQSDCFVTRFNATGSALVYSTYLGGNRQDNVRGIAVDSSGNAYLSGHTTSSNFPTANAFQPNSASNNILDVYVTKLNPAGSALVYSTYLGGTGNELGGGIAVDSSGNAYVVGETVSTDFPTASALQPNIIGPSDAFVTKFNAAGSALVYSTYLGGDGSEQGLGIAVDTAGNAYVTGRTAFSLTFPTANAFQPKIVGGQSDCFVTKFNAAGSALVYSTYLGGANEEMGVSIAVDAAGNAYVTGPTNSPNFPTANSFQPQLTSVLVPDGFVTKFSAAGSLVYSTYLGGNQSDTPTGIAVDSAGSAYVIGLTNSPNFPIVLAFQPNLQGSFDVFVTKLNVAGSALIYSTYLGGGGTDTGSGIAVDSAGNAYGTGLTTSQDFPVTNFSFAAGIANAFVAKIGSFVISGRVVDSASNPLAGATITLSGSNSGTVTTDANGNFMFLATTPGGSFAVTPSKTGYTFNPQSFSTGNLNTDVANILFTGTMPTPTPPPTPTPLPTPTPTTVQFGQSFYNVFEDCAAVTITVARGGDTSQAAAVDYSTIPGTASDRSDFNAAAGTINFAPGETAKSFNVLITEDSFVEATETFNVSLSNPFGVTLGAQATATVQIFDDSPESSGNPIDSADDFVCQHYHDFLNREDDASGVAFWTNEILSCGDNSGCIQQKRANTSGAFFLSIEFQETGGFAIRVQRAAFGRKSADAATRITYAQLIRDGRFLGEGVVVGQPGWDAKLEVNKQAYINQLVASSAFTSAYGAGLTAAQFVDALLAAAGVTATSADRQAAINAFGGGGLSGRAAALRAISDSNSLRAAEFRPSFVLMQYFGYLRRNPTDVPDNNDNGYQFWLAKLNAFNGDFVQAEMVKAFITSFEYRARFGAP